jgi:hypothetical protein
MPLAGAAWFRRESPFLWNFPHRPTTGPEELSATVTLLAVKASWLDHVPLSIDTTR